MSEEQVLKSVSVDSESRKVPGAEDGIGPFEHVVPWTPDFKYPASKSRTFDGEMFQEWQDRELSYLGDIPIGSSKEDEIQVGEFSLARTRVPLHSMKSRWFLGPLVSMRTQLPLHRGLCREWCSFDKEIGLVSLCYAEEYTGTCKAIASISPMEILTQRPGVRVARGDVVVAGLGLGWFVRCLCRRKQVRSVTVIEKDQGVAEYVGSRLMTLPEVQEKNLIVIMGDAYDYPWADVHADCVLWDIWATYGDAHWDRKWETVKGILANRDIGFWGWGDVVTERERSGW